MMSLIHNDLANKYGNVFNEFALISVIDKFGRITYANDKYCEITKYSLDELLGQNHIIQSDCHPDSLYKELWQTITNGEIWNGIMKNKTKDGECLCTKAIIKPLFDFNGTIMEYLVIPGNIVPKGGVMRMPSFTIKIFSPGPSAILPL